MPCTCPVPVRSIQPYTAKQEDHPRSRRSTTVLTIKTLSKTSTSRETPKVAPAAKPSAPRTAKPLISSRSTTQPPKPATPGPSAPGYPQVVTVFHARPNPQTQPVTPQPPRYYPYRTESLPPQTIAGIYVEGTRTTRTTPAGYVGNDRDFVSTTENWYSPTLGLQLRYVSDDPRSGKSTTEVTDLHQTAPDPALFQPPAGYILKDAN